MRIYRIYTKKGDTGLTDGPGGRLEKSKEVFELLGTIDETQAAIGVAYEYTESKVYKEQLQKIMQELYKVSAAVYKQKDIDNYDLAKDMENWMDEMDETLPRITRFILPIGSKASAHCHLARTVSRRLERNFVKEPTVKNFGNILIFLNRLSDYLFVLARKLEEK